MTAADNQGVPNGQLPMMDPITAEVIRYGLDAAADQMRVNLCRTAFSPVIYDGQDFAAGLFDRDMRLLAQARSMPGFLGTLGFCVQALVERVGGPDSLREGDVLFSTWGYDVGSHQQDAAVVVPGFFEGELSGYAAVKAHHMDIGAKDPYCTDTTDIFQEGTIYPGVRLYAGGVRNEELYRTILANSRAPHALAGDLSAQIGSAHVGLRELGRLLKRVGRERFEAAVEGILDHGECVMRDFLRTIPDGRYYASGALDDNAIDLGVPVPIEVEVEIAGDGISIDLTHSADQQRGPVNSPRAMTVSQIRVGLVALAAVGESVNEGWFRPIEVKTRPGSLFEPTPPAPLFLYGWAGSFAMDLMHRALADALPEAIPACSGGHGGAMTWGVDESGSFWMFSAIQPVGMGASAEGDMTVPLLSLPVSGLKTAPTEIQELSGHIVVERFELATDSGGFGRFRGGLGVDGLYRTLDPQLFITLVDRTLSPPWGLDGGGNGRPYAVRLHLPDGSVENVAKVTGRLLPAGTTIEVASGGGGGFGPSNERDPQAVHKDVLEGYVTEAEARREYPHAFVDS